MILRVARLARRYAHIAFIALSAIPSMLVSAGAQEAGSTKHIGFLLVARTPDHEDCQRFRQGLKEAGFTEGRDMVIDWRPVNGDYSRLPQEAAKLVQRKVDVIVVEGTVAAQAAMRATSTIPIVMAGVADPVGSGLVTNLAHPGGNVTGISAMIPDLEAKRLELFKQVTPRGTRVAVLWNSDTPYHAKAIKNLRAAAAALAIDLSFYDVRTPAEFAPATSAIGEAHKQALYVIEDPFFFNHRVQIARLALAAGLPTIFSAREYAEAGGLMSYGTDYGEGFRRSAEYIGKILKGAKPGDLPIEQPTRFELVVNQQTAKALGIVIPEELLLLADRVIR